MTKPSDLYTELCDRIFEVGEVPCHNAPDLFFSDDDENKSSVTMRMAVKLCADCPVKQLCFEYSIDAEEEFGVWGGVMQGARRALLRKNRAARRRVQSTNR